MDKHFIDLFSGAGGMSCGLEMAGWNCLLGIDHDQAAINTFSHNHPKAWAIAADLRKVSTQQIKELTRGKSVDLICGGPPCQGFSTIGRNDHADERNFLFLEFLRVVKEFLPNYIIIENVTGLLAKRNEETLLSIIHSLTDLGYTVDIKVLSAHHYGVPQKRRRTIILGNRLGIANLYPTQQFKDSENDPADLPLARNVQWAFDNLGSSFNHDIDKAQILSELERERLKHIPEGCSIRYEKDQLAYLPKDLWFDVDWSSIREERFREAKLNRLDRFKCSNTINTSKNTYYHPTENRRLTQREAAAIQSFPPDFVFQGTVTQQWKQIGNAVPPLMAKAIGEAILCLDKAKDGLRGVNSPVDIAEARSRAFSYKGTEPVKEEFPRAQQSN